MQLTQVIFGSVAGIVLAAAAQAQGIDLPPADYPGRQFVNAAGCVFLREGEGAAARWQARLGRDGQPLCGYPPSPVPAPDAAPSAVVPSAVAETAPVVELAPVAEPAPKAEAVAETAPAVETPPAAKPQKPRKARKAVNAPPPRFVQVGVFARVENAVAAKAKLRALGHGVASAHARHRGQKLEAVLAGPFDTPEALRAALAQLRGAGFSDAYLR
jgi:cell division protein FtsN